MFFAVEPTRFFRLKYVAPLQFDHLQDHPAGMVIGSPGVIAVHVVMKESLSACAS